MKTIVQSVFYIVLLFWIIAFVKMILTYIRWDADTIFFTGCMVLTFGFIPAIMFSYWKKSKNSLVWILVISILLSFLAGIAGTKTAFHSFLPNFWIGIILQAFSFIILSFVTSERKTILLIWIIWLVFSIVLMTIHILNGTL